MASPWGRASPNSGTHANKPMMSASKPELHMRAAGEQKVGMFGTDEKGRVTGQAERLSVLIHPARVFLLTYTAMTSPRNTNLFALARYVENPFQDLH